MVNFYTAHYIDGPNKNHSRKLKWPWEWIDVAILNERPYLRHGRPEIPISIVAFVARYYLVKIYRRGHLAYSQRPTGRILGGAS